MTGDPDLIGEYRRIHAEQRYGDTSVKNLRFIRPEVRLLKPKSVLDYGCGQSKLLERLDLGPSVELHRYDPAIPAFATKPTQKADLLINIDVLEHIEETDLPAVLAEMASLCTNAIIIVDTKPAVLRLADGRNAHVTLKPHAWWREQISRHFGNLEPMATVRSSRAGFKTWKRPAGDQLAYLGLRAVETAKYVTNKLQPRG